VTEPHHGASGVAGAAAAGAGEGAAAAGAGEGAAAAGPGERHVLCGVDEVAPGTARRFDVGTHRIAVVRCEDDFYAIGDRCTHADISLSEGEILCDEREIECWKHGSTFSLETGEPQSLPATRATPVYDVELDDGKVVVVIRPGVS
jgi:3-phenylpropionate/trans-cinnamate dioxygenase ferredoxin component